MNNVKLQLMLEDVLLGKKDQAFTKIFYGMHCMSSPRVYGVLNACVSSMGEGELYVEVGTYQGGSLIAALQDNDAHAIGVDSFSEFTKSNSFDLTSGHVKEFELQDRVTLYNMRYEQFFAEHPDLKIQVYYYDGAHDYETQLNGMEAAWRHLQPGSLILVDDYTYPEVSRAVNQFVTNHIEQVKFLFVLLPVQSNDELWWNGIVVLRVM